MEYLKRLRKPAPSTAQDDAYRARVDVLRELLRTPVQAGDEEYESLLKKVFDDTTALLKREPGPHRGLESEAGWEAAGFQAKAPDREFRGGGALGLHCLLYALEHHADRCAELLDGPFPFAAASINMTLVVARLAGVAEAGTDDDVACDPLADASGARTDVTTTARRCMALLGGSHDGFFELHGAALDALDRARRNVDAGPMDFAGCAAAARDEVAVLLAHGPEDGAAVRRLAAAVPRRRNGFLVARRTPPSSSSLRGLMRRLDARPRRQWFALSTGTLRWYDEGDVHAHARGRAATLLTPGRPAGSLRLAGDMTVKFRAEEKSFSVADRDGATLLWLDAADQADMEQWCIALTEHASLAALDSSTLALKARAQSRTLSEERFEPAATFAVDDAVGIYVRSAPDVAATRTGRGLMPGARVRVSSRARVEDDAAGPTGRAFLRLVDPDGADAGWVMEHHPTTFLPILVRVDAAEAAVDEEEVAGTAL